MTARTWAFLTALVAALVLIAVLFFIGKRGDEPARPVIEPAQPAVHDDIRPSLPGAAESERSHRTRAATETTTATLAEIAGRVVNWRGRSIEGATVRLLGMPEGEPTSAVSDGNGRFRLTAPAGEIDGRTLSVTAADCKPLELVLSGATDDLTIRMKPTTVELRGRVLDADTGSTVPGALVSAMNTTVAADDGTYRIPEIPVGVELSVSASKPGYLGADVTILARGSQAAERDILLSRATEVTVEVFDRATGRPIPGAEVREREHGEVLARTSSTGCFSVSVAKGNTLMRHVTAEGYGNFLWLWEPRELDDDVRPRIPLQPGVSIDGVVTNREGQAVAEASVVVTHSKLPGGDRAELSEAERDELGVVGWGAFVGPISSYAKTDEEGRFSLEAVAREEPHGVYVWHDEYMARRVEGISLTSPGDRASVAVVLDRGATVRGRVVMDGTPLPGVDVVGGGARATTDAEGAYVLKHVEPGEVRLATIHGQEAFLTIEDGASYEQDFIWEDTRASVQGRVTTVDGTPLEDVRVQAYCGGRCRDFPRWARTGEDGRYTLLLGNHAHEITARNGVAQQTLEAIAPSSKDVDFVLPSLHRSRFRLVDSATRRPIQPKFRNFHRQIAARMSGAREFRSVPCRIDVDGEVALELPVGTVDLHIHVGEAGYAPRRVRDVWIDPDRSEPPRVIALDRGHTVELEITDPQGYAKAREGHLVFFLEEQQIDSVRGPFDRSGPPANMGFGGINAWLENPCLVAQMPSFGRDGRCRIPGLAPGTYRLRAFPDDIAFTPETIEVGEALTSAIAIAWRTR